MRRIMGFLALCLALCVPGTAMAASFDILLRLDGIAGDSRFTGYVGWIEVNSWSVGHGLAPSTGTAGARPLSLNKKIDRSSTSLAAAAAAGTRIKSAVLDVMQLAPSGGVSVPAYRVILHDVTVRSYGVASPSGSVPNENVELGYSRIEWYQFSLANDGVTLLQTQAKFDFSKNLPYQ